MLRTSGWYPQTVGNREVPLALQVFVDEHEIYYTAAAHVFFPILFSVCWSNHAFPAKTVTISWLELTVPLLMVGLAGIVRRELQPTVTDNLFWSDYGIVTYYVGNAETRFATLITDKLLKTGEFS